MTRVFLYPLHHTFKGSPNPYMHNFREAMEKQTTVVNANSVHRGVLNLFLYFFRTDVFILNWIEFLAEKRFGRVQVFFFLLFCKLSRFFGKKIIWVLHNKGSHHGGAEGITEHMFQVLMKRSNHIITHSNSGKMFVKENYPLAANKIEVIMHPVEPPFYESVSSEKIYDILIWGSIHPYKGIDQFLAFAKNSSQFGKYKILIVGKCFDPDYKEKILAYMTENVTYEDKVYSLKEISNFASKSKFVLFTYKSETIISSGVLMDTFRMDTQIIGPDYAAFGDLKMLSCINTYNTFEEISSVIDNYDSSNGWDFAQRERFYHENSWNSFANKVLDILKAKI